MKIIFICLAHVIFSSCGADKNINSGYIEQENLVWHSLEKKYVPDDWVPVSKYIYKDSFIIYRRNMIMGHEDAFGNKKSWLELMYYCFADLRNDTYYEFDSLKVDAKCLKQYKHANSDSGKIGINYYETIIRKFTPSEYEYEGVIKSDTMLEGIKHTLYTKHISTKWPLPGGGFRIDTLVTTMRWYYRHDLQTPLLRLNREADREQNAILVRFDTQPDHRYNEGNLVYGTFHLKYYPKKLTAAEESVFSAWARYAAEHPVKE
jgi:hypothetical protein